MTLETQLIFPLKLLRAKEDYFHFFFHGDAPSFSLKPFFISALDLIPLKFKELYSTGKEDLRFHFARFLENRSIKSAKGVFAISQTTKEDLIEILNIDPNKIVVTPLGVDSRFFVDLDLDPDGVKRVSPFQVSEKIINNPALLKLIDSKFVYVGGIDERKNISFLIKAFSQLILNREDQGLSTPKLVIIGRILNDKNYPKLKKLISDYNLDTHVEIKGYLSDSEMITELATARAFIFPSLYEGFGLPVIEAMASGVPVIAGDNSSVAEIINNKQGILVADNDQAKWVESMEQILDSDELYLDLKERGRKRAGDFLWSKTAELTVAGYEKFLEL
mgnify:CR=1 FL=1